MGQMDPDDDGFGEAAVHVPVSSGPDTPSDCEALVDAWTSGGGDGEWLADNTEDFLPGTAVVCTVTA
jgi:hypothetical protein